ncbi:MAG: hypothetical protein O2992_12005 [Gemmatimonadetes bacterium]|jgi:hypothetical protein|nr:hypothetical protein [Gemmatimonadota bacterium]
MRSSIRPLTTRGAVLACVTLALLFSSAGARGQTTPADSTRILKESHKFQEEFERYRESRIPPMAQPDGQVCDERIGTICIWFGGDENERFPAEFREVGQARVEFIRSLFDGFEEIKDRWILGQLVHYLVESRNIGEAERVANECGITETWWCSALLGYVLHIKTEYVPAEAAFRESLAAMSDAQYEAWTTPRFIFTPDARDEFERAAPAERERKWELFWRLSDPLFLFEGNDRLTDHFARLVVAENRRDAADPMGGEWDEFQEETLVRYGRNIGYSRVHNPGRTMSLGGGLQDTRRMVGHHHPKSRGYLFPETYLESPSDIPPESWITAPREARTWYAPPYAPEIRALETQVGRFRRDGMMLVVGAYRPTIADPTAFGGVSSAWREGGGIAGPANTALFLIPEDGGESVYVQGTEPEGVLTIETLPGHYVSGLEVVDLQGRQAWRARQGVIQRPLTAGLVDVSDLLILREGATLPESLDEAIPDVRPGVRLRPGERFAVVWEAYGLGILEPIQVTIGFNQGRPGFLSRIGEFLGVIAPDRPVDVTFDDVGPDRVQAAFRSVMLELPDLEPGDYTLHLQLDLFGRTPIVTSRPIIVEGSQ